MPAVVMRVRLRFAVSHFPRRCAGPTLQKLKGLLPMAKEYTLTQDEIRTVRRTLGIARVHYDGDVVPYLQPDPELVKAIDALDEKLPCLEQPHVPTKIDAYDWSSEGSEWELDPVVMADLNFEFDPTTVQIAPD